MNYIRHLTGFFDRAGKDHRLNATHISMYMAVFQFWNLNRFKNPISIARSEIMVLSKVSSKNTYHKCLKELHQYGYLRYDPSYHPLRGSWVYLFVFKANESASQYKNETSDEQALYKQESGVVQDENKLSAESEARSKLPCPLNIYKHSKHNKLSFSTDGEIAESPGKEKKEAAKIKNSFLPCDRKYHLEQPACFDGDPPATTSVVEISTTHHPKEPEKIPAGPEAVLQYFQESGFPESQALKFFHYYTATGWRIGGKSPIENWHSAANSWMLNTLTTSNPATNQIKHKTKLHASQLHSESNKDYAEPL